MDCHICPERNVIGSQDIAEQIVEFRRQQTREVLPRQAVIYQIESERCAMLAESNLQTLRNLYSQPAAANFSLQAALDQSARYTTNAYSKVVAELKKRFQAMQRAPDAPLWANTPDHVVIPAEACPFVSRQTHQGQGQVQKQQQAQQATTSRQHGTNFAGRQAPRQPVTQQSRQPQRPLPYNQNSRRGCGGQNRGGQNRGNQNRGRNNNQQQQAILRAMAQTLMNMLRDQF